MDVIYCGLKSARQPTLLACRDGKSRCFGFVGLKSATQAAAASKYFHMSFMDTCRLEIEFAESYKSRTTPGPVSLPGARPWSKHSVGSSAHKASLDAAAGVEKGASGIHADTEQKTGKSKKSKVRGMWILPVEFVVKTVETPYVRPTRCGADFFYKPFRRV